MEKDGEDLAARKLLLLHMLGSKGKLLSFLIFKIQV
jgi:hypothetical protein